MSVYVRLAAPTLLYARQLYVVASCAWASAMCRLPPGFITARFLSPLTIGALQQTRNSHDDVQVYSRFLYTDMFVGKTVAGYNRHTRF